jgi:hypothetical protein
VPVADETVTDVEEPTAAETESDVADDTEEE